MLPTASTCLRGAFGLVLIFPTFCLSSTTSLTSLLHHDDHHALLLYRVPPRSRCHHQWCLQATNLRQVQRDLGASYTQSDDYFSAMLAAVKKQRAAAQGLSSLCMNKKLQAAAQRHSNDQAKNNFMAHDGLDGSTMSERITQAGYKWSAVAENVAAGQVDVDAVMESWMNFPGHRANILGADYTMFGTAYAYNADSTYKHYWTQDFGSGSTKACDGSDSIQQSAVQN